MPTDVIALVSNFGIAQQSPMTITFADCNSNKILNDLDEVQEWNDDNSVYTHDSQHNDEDKDCMLYYDTDENTSVGKGDEYFSDDIENVDQHDEYFNRHDANEKRQENKPRPHQQH